MMPCICGLPAQQAALTQRCVIDCLFVVLDSGVVVGPSAVVELAGPLQNGERLGRDSESIL